MQDTIKENNKIRESQLLNAKANEMTKAEFIAMNILSGLVSNDTTGDYEELVNKSVELSKLLIKKISY